MDWNEDEYETILRQFQPRKPSLPPEMLAARPRRRGLWIGAAAAVILLGILSITILRNPQVVDAHAVVEVSDGSLFRVSGEKTLPVAVGESVDAGEIVRSEGGGGAVLALKDGTRFEMRSQSEFSVERVADGLRINLRKGSLIIDAAKQIDRRLSVRSKDFLVFSVGTVFVVTVEEEGSRVVVIEGEVRVEQGVMAKNLRSGEQLTTNPLMEPLLVHEELSWSRNAERILLLFQQSSSLPMIPASKHSADASAFPVQRLAFDVVSIRSRASIPPLPIGDGRGGSASSSCAGTVKSDARRFTARDISLYQLILLAYGNGDCDLASRLGLLPGGPKWLKSDRFDFEAILPEDIPGLPGQFSGPAGKTVPALGSDGRLEKMLQTLLADRFKLALHREMKEMPVYLLTVAKGGPKLRSSKEEVTWETGTGNTNENGEMVADLRGAKASMTDLASHLSIFLRKPVLDRTGIKGVYDYRVEFEPIDSVAASSRPSVFKALKDELGLVLESAKAPVEVLSIDRLERPSPN